MVFKLAAISLQNHLALIVFPRTKPRVFLGYFPSIVSEVVINISAIIKYKEQIM